MFTCAVRTGFTGADCKDRPDGILACPSLRPSLGHLPRGPCARRHPPGTSSQIQWTGLAIIQLLPACGGLGLLPLVPHVRARHAGLTTRCVLGACDLLSYVPPWTKVAKA